MYCGVPSVAVVLDVARKVHGGHAAFADLAIELVAACEGAGQDIERIHGSGDRKQGRGMRSETAGGENAGRRSNTRQAEDISNVR
jgi:hypothetical protein